jgi:predicted nucleic acid-binding protein
VILVDSNVIIDVLTRDPVWGSWSRSALARGADEDEVAINPVVYAEVSVGFTRIELLEAAMVAVPLRRLVLPYEAGFLAGKAFIEYRRRGGARTSPLPDFYIGAHAAIARLKLLTRDARRYASYFPGLRMMSPT